MPVPAHEWDCAAGQPQGDVVLVFEDKRSVLDAPFCIFDRSSSVMSSFVLELHGEWAEFADECMGP